MNAASPSCAYQSQHRACAGQSAKTVPRRTCREGAVPHLFLEFARQPARCPVHHASSCIHYVVRSLMGLDFLDRHRRGAILAPCLHTAASVPPIASLRHVELRRPLHDMSPAHEHTEEVGNDVRTAFGQLDGEEESSMLRRRGGLREASKLVAMRSVDDFPAVIAIAQGTNQPEQDA